MGGGRSRDAVENMDDVINQRDAISHHNVASRDIVVIGASAGGVEALQAVVRGLPADLPAAIFVVLHIPRRGPRALAAILDRAGPLPAAQAEDGAMPMPGRIYVAPSDYHLVLSDGLMHLRHDAAVNGHRPSIDALFRSAARVYGERLIGVVLSGAGDDGAAGLSTAVSAGAIAIVQDPAQAGHPSMPQQACAQVPDALVRRAEEIGPLVGQLVLADLPPRQPTDAQPGGDNQNGAALDSALWLALRALEEKSALNSRMARSRRRCGDEEMASRYEELADESDGAIDMIRQLLKVRQAADLEHRIAG